MAAATAALSAGLLSSAGLFYAGAEFGRTTPHGGAAYGVSLSALNRTRAGSPIALAAAELSVDCYTFTGGTCLVKECDADRHAECQSGLCVCKGACSGADGKCYSAHNVPVEAGFTLTNKKFNWQKLYMPSLALLGQMKTSALASAFLFGKDKFILHRLPGKVNGKTDYFLTTVAYPDYVAAIRATAGTAFSLFGAYDMGLSKDFAIDRLAVQVCSKGDGDIMIGSVGSVETEWFYIHHGSWNVYGTADSDPGDGAIWVTDPPIHDGVLPVCE